MYSIVKQGNHEHYGIVSLVADTATDVTSAPTNVAPGSKMFCIANSKTYILNNNHIWVECN